MQRDRLNKGSNAQRMRGRQGRAQTPPIGRSPALEAAQRSIKQSEERRRSGRSSRKVTLGKMRYAVEETIVAPEPARKSLPAPRPQGRRGDTAKLIARGEARPGLTTSWRSHSQALEQAAPVSVMSEEEQKKLAALEMRLPRVAGKIDTWLLVIVLALLCIGLVMVYSASSYEAAEYYGDASYFFQKQMLWAFLGVVAMLVTMRIDYRSWRRFSLVGMGIILPLLVLVLFVGTNIYGATRWLPLGPFFSFQPSELAKLVLALYIADWLARKGNKVGTFLYGLAPFVILVGVVLGLVLLERDMGTAIIIGALATAMFFTAGANIVQFLLAVGCGGLIFLTQAFRGYRLYRMLGFLNPFQNTLTFNAQLYQSLLALGSGGWLGLGLGASRQKTGYLPLPYIDSIFAIIGEELGFIGCAVLVILFLFLAFRGFRLARRTQDVYGALLATGITTWLVLQAMINIGATTGTIPYTGVPLPFISAGGSSLVVIMAAVGILLNISRYTQQPEVPALTRALTKTFKRRA